MKVSVVIPAYNEEKWIGKTLEAVLAQDYSNFEVIVVNNASTDETADIVRSFTDPRLTLVFEPNKGLLHAREAGRKAATGTIIAQLDADCLPGKHWIKNAMSYFKNPKVVAVTGAYYYYDSPWLTKKTALIGQLTIHALMCRLVQTAKRGGLIIGGNTFIRKEALDKAGGYNTRLNFYGEDTDTACRIVPYGRIAYSNRNILPTSGRRFEESGFWKINAKYIHAFFTVLRKGTYHRSKEEKHPR